MGSFRHSYAVSNLSRPIFWAIVLICLAGWSLIAWIGYAFADSILVWVATNAGFVLDRGKGLTTLAGKDANSVVQSIGASGILGQTIIFLSAVLKPAIITLWAVGTLAILATPLILRRLGRRRH